LLELHAIGVMANQVETLLRLKAGRETGMVFHDLTVANDKGKSCARSHRVAVFNPGELIDARIDFDF
jgi:hypothetical protein